MAKLKMLTGGRAWAARLLVLLPVLALAGLILAVLPAGAQPGQDPTTNGWPPISDRHVGGNAWEDCEWAETELFAVGAGFTEYTAFSNNPRNHAGTLLPIVNRAGSQFDSDPTADPGGEWYVYIDVPSDIRDNDDSFDLKVVIDDNGNGVFDDPDDSEPANDTLAYWDQGFEAPRGRNLSHASFCFTENAPVLWSVAVKGARNTNYYANFLRCGENQDFGDDETSYTVSLQACEEGKGGALITAFGFGPDFVALSTSGSGMGYYLEELHFEALVANPDLDQPPRILYYDDEPPFPTDPLEGTVVPRCEFNPDGDNDGMIDDPTTVGNALPWINPEDHSQGKHTTCYYWADAHQLVDGTWVFWYRLLNEGDGYRGMK